LRHDPPDKKHVEGSTSTQTGVEPKNGKKNMNNTRHTEHNASKKELTLHVLVKDG
jgi:hypothetical protein